MEQPILVKKIAIADTLRQFCVGQSRVFKFSEVKYTNLYPTVKRLERSTKMRFTVSIKGLVDGTMVRRDA